MAAKPSESTDAVELTDSAAPKHGFFVRLYTGTGAFEVIGKRKMWYAISGAIVGGLMIGMLEKLFEIYWGQPLLGGNTETWFAFMLALVVLLFRPQGLFGERIIERV